MSIKTKLGTAVDVATLVAASTVTIGGALMTYKMVKNKNGALMITWGVLVTLVGVAASKYSLQKIRSVKETTTTETTTTETKP